VTGMRSLAEVWAKPGYRSLNGFVAALAILPALLGVLACLKTSVGDPERSRIDPRLTGIWISGDPQLPDARVSLWVLEPYDARTWLISMLEFKRAVASPAAGEGSAAQSGKSAEPAPAAGGPEEIVVVQPPQQGCGVMPALAALNESHPNTALVGIFKAWLTTLGGQRFLVLEPKGRTSSRDGFRPEYWFPMRVQLNEGRLLLSLVHSAGDLDTTTSRAKAEQIISRHASEPTFYEKPNEFVSVPRAGYDCVRRIFRGVGFGGD